MMYIEIIAGLVLLFFGGDYLVSSGVQIARRLKLTPLIIGMTIVAFGTSAPEFLVSLEASISGHSEMSLGNVIGSNIANIGLILGLTALILPIAVNKISIKMDAPFMIVCSFILIAVMLNSEVSRYEGIMLVSALIVYVVYQISVSKKKNQEAIEPPTWSIYVALIVLVASCTALAFGSNLLIKGASALATSLGVSERIISITIVAFGTSVPEFAASLAAAIKKETDIAIGNIIGSNIFNILFVIGMSSVVSPIKNFAFQDFKLDLVWMCTFAIMLFICILPVKRLIKKNKNKQGVYSKLGRISGAFLLTAYLIYVYTLIAM